MSDECAFINHYKFLRRGESELQKDGGQDGECWESHGVSRGEFRVDMSFIDELVEIVCSLSLIDSRRLVDHEKQVAQFGDTKVKRL